jgi:hypothetical protein
MASPFPYAFPTTDLSTLNAEAYTRGASGKLSFPCGRIRSNGDLPSSGADPAGSPKTQIARICATRLVACRVAASPINPRQSSNMVDAKSTGAVRWVNLVFAWVRRALRGFRRLSRLRVWSCLTRIKPNIAKERLPNRRFSVICQLLLPTDPYCNDSGSRSSTAYLLRTTLGSVFDEPSRQAH